MFIFSHYPSQIADFGMSRDLADTNYYVSHGGMIPIKWTAPEVGLYDLLQNYYSDNYHLRVT